MIKHNLLELLEDGETVVPLAGTGMAVLWRASLLDPGGVSYTRGHAARLTLIDLIPELFGIASLWLKDDFFQNYSRHFEHTGEYEGPITLAALRARKAARKPTSLLTNQSGDTPSAPAVSATARSLVPNEIAMRAKQLMQQQPSRTFVSAYAEALVLLLNDSKWQESALMHVRGSLVDGNRTARHNNRTARIARLGNATARNASRLLLKKSKLAQPRNWTKVAERRALRRAQLRNRTLRNWTNTGLKKKAALLEEMVRP